MGRNFGEGFRLARERVLLARDDERDPNQVNEYIFRRECFAGNLGTNFFGGLASVAGYAVGNYTTFCPTQAKLDSFDLLIENL